MAAKPPPASWRFYEPILQLKWSPFAEWVAYAELKLPGKIYRIYAEGSTSADALANAKRRLQDHPWRSLGHVELQD